MRTGLVKAERKRSLDFKSSSYSRAIFEEIISKTIHHEQTILNEVEAIEVINKESWRQHMVQLSLD